MRNMHANKTEFTSSKSGERLCIETHSINKVGFWESNGINNNFFGNAKFRFLLPSFSSNSELVFLGHSNLSSLRGGLKEDVHNLELRTVLLGPRGRVVLELLHEL